MTRPRLLAALGIALLSFVLWLLLRSEPAPEPQRLPAEEEAAAPTAPPVHVEDSVPAAVERQAPPTPSDQRAAPGPSAPVTGLRGVVQEEGGPSLPDILVELLDAHGATVQATTTDAEGRFAFDQLAPDAATIATRPAPAGLPRIGHGMPRSRGPGPGGPGPGGAASSTIRLWRPPSGAITGIVVGDRGEPVAGATVGTDRPYVSLGMVRWKVLEGEEPRMSASATTAADGRFELPFCRHGQHLLRARLGEQSGSVKVDADAAGVVIRLGTHLGGAVVLAGQLTDRITGAPIAGARIWIQRVRRAEHGSSAIGVARVATDLQGRYEVQGLEAGLYGLQTMPDGYAPAAAEGEFADGNHVLDLTALPARQVRVRVVLPDGRPVKGAQVRVRDAAGGTVQVPALMDMLGDGVRTDAEGVARLRRMPAAVLTLSAACADFTAAGRIELDLRQGAPEEVTIELPSAVASFARQHFFKLLDVHGKPAVIEGTVVASAFDGEQLLSRVEGRWRDGRFYLGNDQQYDFAEPIVAVGASAGACRIEIAAPGYQVETLTLEPGAQSPTKVTLRR
ncbi:MAG: carboxypeptidase regulatory-like domain-containing protein [Planctomycetes bacterium]|nr:carboxypeptidase regulatory-like domain-containing protein [Planctomycetota bacterium]